MLTPKQESAILTRYLSVAEDISAARILTADQYASRQEDAGDRLSLRSPDRFE